jgi:hypothetical protein
MSARAGTVNRMNPLLTVVISAAVTGAIGYMLSPTLTKALLALARARAQRVEHVPVSGTQLYNNGVPLTEEQFREVFAAMQAELDELSPPAERCEWELKRQYAAINRLSVFAGTYPHAFPMRGNADDAWNWYKDHNPYATTDLPRRHRFAITAPGIITPPWQRVSQPPAG